MKRTDKVHKVGIYDKKKFFRHHQVFQDETKSSYDIKYLS